MKIRPAAIGLGLAAMAVIGVIAVTHTSPAPRSAVSYQQFGDPPWVPRTTIARATRSAPITAAPDPTTTEAAATTVAPTTTTTRPPAPAPTAAPKPPVVKTPVVRPQEIVSSAPGKWACIIARESGGNPGAINPTSMAGGLFQFLPSSWRAYGGTGNAWQASVAEQWRVALHAYAVSGWSPWAGGNYRC